MRTDERITYNMVDGSILEIIGRQVINEEHEDGAHKYYLESGKIVVIMDNAVSYYTISEAPEDGDGIC